MSMYSLWFKCWCPNEDDEPAEPNVNACDAEHAAEIFAEDGFSDRDCPVHTTVHVRDKDGMLRVYDVQAEEVWNFSAAEIVT